MVILRATAKVLRSLPPPSEPGRSSDTALGDWYVNRIVVHCEPLLLLVSSTSLLALVDRARDVRALPGRLAELVAVRLQCLEVAPPLVEAEVSTMLPVEVAKTADRAVLGILVDFARSIPYYLPPGVTGDAGLRRVESMLARTPCYVGATGKEVVFPRRKAPELLRAKWGAG